MSIYLVMACLENNIKEQGLVWATTILRPSFVPNNRIYLGWAPCNRIPVSCLLETGLNWSAYVCSHRARPSVLLSTKVFFLKWEGQSF